MAIKTNVEPVPRIIVLIALFLLSNAAQAANIRVKLTQAKQIDLHADEKMVLTPMLAPKKYGLQKDISGTAHISVCGKDICASGIRSPRVQVFSESPYIKIGAKKMPSDLILLQEAGNISVVAVLDVEVYLEGVLGREMSPSWPLEALKSQAIVARTYAYRKMQLNATKDYDIRSTTSDQVFEWGNRPGATIRQAILQTEGWILTADGVPADTYFHADSGGHTAGTEEIWTKATPGITAKKDPWSPARVWQVKLDPRADGDKLGVGKLREIRIIEKSSSGRAYKVQVRGSAKTAIMRADQLRAKLGYNRVRSTMFLIKGLSIDGRGFGHGIGLAQSGAKSMAEANYTWQEILDFYFPEMFLVPAE